MQLDADLRVGGDLATEWSRDADGVTWTIMPRDDARLSDGASVTAEDVAFIYHTARDAGGLADLEVLAGARATGPLTVTVTLSEPRVTFLCQRTTLGIVQKAGFGADYTCNPLGSGPFRMVEWCEDEALIVAPHPHWHGGRVAFDRIGFVFVFVEEDARIALALNWPGRPARGPVDGLPWDNPEAQLPGDDPAGAMALLDAAGWTESDGTGTRDRDGTDAAFTIVFPASVSTRQALALGVQAQLEGIRAGPGSFTLNTATSCPRARKSARCRHIRTATASRSPTGSPTGPGPAPDAVQAPAPAA